MQFNKESFWSLLSKSEIENITIPIIQRAYTQGGRSGDTKIEVKGQKFLDRLILALIDTSKPILLDFVYGSESKNKVFPLDGQQRLTTLFLLHWYIFQKEGKLDDTAKKIFKKFTYETRQSSRYFCEHLCDYIIPISRKEKLSDTIKNEKWFMLSWENDPSICSMFGMLDKIDVALKNDTKLRWDILTQNIENCPITFFYTSLQDLNLTDDLYIKMNARGLELTDFEKLKAAFNQKIDNEKWDEGKSITDKFGHRIDTVWTDLFWKYKGADGLIDNELVNFIAGIAINCYAVNYVATDKDKIEKRIAELANNSTAVCPDDFPTKDAYNYFVNCLNKYAENNHDIIKSNTDIWDYCEKTLFEDFITDKPNYKRRTDYYTYPMRVLFYAQTEYLLKNAFDQTKFDEWMRVVRNIVKNSTIDSATTFISAITLIKELTNGCNDIYDYLSKNTVSAGHAKKQVQQEIEKAKIIATNSKDNKPVIFDTEDTNFCKGDIDFALYCIDYPTVAFDVTKLRALQSIIRSELDVNSKITDDFKRAFLTIKNNDYYNVWRTWSWSFECDKRWLLDKNSKLVDYFAKGNDYWRAYLKDLLLQRMSSKNFAEIADNYTIPATMPKWKEKLIKGTAKLEGATFILIPNDNSFCKLAWTQRPRKEGQVRKIE
jgi:hypothetical protein